LRSFRSLTSRGAYFPSPSFSLTSSSSSSSSFSSSSSSFTTHEGGEKEVKKRKGSEKTGRKVEIKLLARERKPGESILGENRSNEFVVPEFPLGPLSIYPHFMEYFTSQQQKNSSLSELVQSNPQSLFPNPQSSSLSSSSSTSTTSTSSSTTTSSSRMTDHEKRQGVGMFVRYFAVRQHTYETGIVVSAGQTGLWEVVNLAGRVGRFAPSLFHFQMPPNPNHPEGFYNLNECIELYHRAKELAYPSLQQQTQQEEKEKEKENENENEKGKEEEEKAAFQEEESKPYQQYYMKKDPRGLWIALKKGLVEQTISLPQAACYFFRKKSHWQTMMSEKGHMALKQVMEGQLNAWPSSIPPFTREELLATHILMSDGYCYFVPLRSGGYQVLSGAAAHFWRDRIPLLENSSLLSRFTAKLRLLLKSNPSVSFVRSKMVDEYVGRLQKAVDRYNTSSSSSSSPSPSPLVFTLQEKKLIDVLHEVQWARSHSLAYPDQVADFLERTFYRSNRDTLVATLDTIDPHSLYHPFSASCVWTSDPLRSSSLSSLSSSSSSSPSFSSSSSIQQQENGNEKEEDVMINQNSSSSSSSIISTEMNKQAPYIRPFHAEPEDKRADFSKLSILCIDKETTYDVDDGVAVETDETTGKTKVHIVISDVSRFIDIDSEINTIGKTRMTSLYLPHRTFPMFSSELESEYLSLLPHRHSYGLSFSAVIANDGAIESYHIQPVFLPQGSVHRLSYDQVDALLDPSQFLPPHRSSKFVLHSTHPSFDQIDSSSSSSSSSELLSSSPLPLSSELLPSSTEMLSSLSSLSSSSSSLSSSELIINDNFISSLLSAPSPMFTNEASKFKAALNSLEKISDQRKGYRIKQGAVNQPNPEFSLEIKGETKEIQAKITQRTKSRQIVEEMMILAGEIAAKYMEEKGIPSLYRTHGIGLLSNSGLDIIETHFPSEVWQFCLQGLFQKASLSSQPGRHFALGVNGYSRVTSPIRRFLDLVNHRQIKSYLYGYSLPYTDDMLAQLARRDQLREQEAKRLSQDSFRAWCGRYFQQEKLFGHYFDAMVVYSHLTPLRLNLRFVTLNTAIPQVYLQSYPLTSLPFAVAQQLVPGTPIQIPLESLVGRHWNWGLPFLRSQAVSPSVIQSLRLSGSQLLQAIRYALQLQQ
jgi:exoribonuclease II